MAGPTPEGFYDLTFGNDNLQLTPGLLAGSPLGLRALDGNDIVRGSIDNEIIFGNLGNDSLYGGSGNDFVWGGKENDVLFGDDGDDNLNGNMGNDIVFGGVGNDVVRGGKDADALFGEAGDDILIGDFGTDFLIGGQGSDLFVLRTDTVLADPESADLIIDFDKFSDRIGLTDGITEANLILTSETISISNALNNPQLANLGLTPDIVRQAFLFFGGVDIDPNGDGFISGTAIRIAGSAQLGFAVNVTPTDLSGRFVSINV